MQKRTHALILKRLAYGDSDWIVTMFSRDVGRMGGIAKFARSSRRRFGGALETGTLVDMKYVERNGAELVRIDQADVLRPINGVLKSLARISAMTRALELALTFLQERQPSPEKFDMLEGYLSRLNLRDPGVWDILSFEFRWISHCGFMPKLSGCAHCERDLSEGGRFAFDFDQGGLLCEACSKMSRGKLFLTRGALDGFSKLSNGTSDGDENEAAAAGHILGRYVEHILGRPMKSHILFGM